VSAELSRYPAGGERIQRLLAELLAHQEESEQFFSGIFAQWDALSARLTHYREHTPSPRESEWQQRLRAMAQERTALEHQQVVLEAERESLRSRLAEVSETVAAQKQQLVEQQRQSAGELRRMGRLLDGIARRLALPENPGLFPPGTPAAPAENPTTAG
jgi:uncharacterized protein involved in exopolysaccharide biosynthesis